MLTYFLVRTVLFLKVYLVKKRCDTVYFIKMPKDIVEEEIEQFQ